MEISHDLGQIDRAAAGLDQAEAQAAPQAAERIEFRLGRLDVGEDALRQWVSTSPAAVSRTDRLLRANKRAPTSASRRAICSLSADWAT